MSFCIFSTEVKATKLADVCQTFIKSGDYQLALKECQELLETSEREKDNPDTVFLYLHLANIFNALGKAESESLFLSKAANHPAFSIDSEVAYLWNRKMGQKNYFLKNYVEAKTFLQQGLKIAKNENNKLWMSKSYNDVGLIESQLSNFRESLINYQKSLALKLLQGDLYSIGTTLNNIGLIYVKLEKNKESITYYERALNSFLEYSNEADFDRRVFDNINHLYEDLAVAYSRINDVENERYYRDKTLESLELKNSTRQRARALVNIAKLQIDSEQYDTANEFLETAAKLQSLHEFDLRVEIDFQYARLYLKTGESEKAVSYANGSLIAAKEKKDFLLLAELYQILNKAYFKKDINSAYHYQSLYSQAREEYLEQKFDSELKSVQIEIEKQQVERDLVLEQVENSKNQLKIQALTTWSLAALILLILCIGFIVFYLFKKKKEKQALLLSITYHKQQLLLLDDKYQHLNKSLVSASHDKDNKQLLREILVSTMLDAVAIWETHTGKNRVELAEKSKVWTVSIDGGTLRTRSLDKYLSMDKIPLNPRWRNVAGTCHFILSDPELAAKDRLKMNERLESLMQAVKKLSLTATE